jgi:hypothetical protein
MRIVRALCFGLLVVGLAGFGLAILPGCGDESQQSGTVLNDEAQQAKTKEAMLNFAKSKSSAQKTGNAPAGGTPTKQ